MFLYNFPIIHENRSDIMALRPFGNFDENVTFSKWLMKSQRMDGFHSDINASLNSEVDFIKDVFWMEIIINVHYLNYNI